MYGWIWRNLPGDTVTKMVWAAGLIAAVAGLLWFLVFPWVEPRVRYDHGTVENTGTVENGATPSPRR
jgi:hypothetical protein